MKGVVKWYSPEKGFGFIVDENGDEIFVYYIDIVSAGFKSLKKGQDVEFDPGQGERGPSAKNVTVI